MNDNPYAAPVHGLDRHPASDEASASGDFVYVGFWKRVLASIIDNILLGVACLPLMFAFPAVITNKATADLTYNLSTSVISIAVILLFWQFKQSTPGKMVFGARIVDSETYGKPTFGRLFLRYIGYIPASLVFCLGFIWVAFDKKKRGWHDLMAGTLVVSPKPMSDRRRPPQRTKADA